MMMSFDLEPDEQLFRGSKALHRRHISEEQMRMFEGDIAAIFTAFGLDLDTSATRETPQRFLRATFDATEGYEGDPKLLTVFETECRGGPDCRQSQVIEGPLHFFSLCEHHALRPSGSGTHTSNGHCGPARARKIRRTGTCCMPKS